MGPTEDRISVLEYWSSYSCRKEKKKGVREKIRDTDDRYNGFLGL